MAELLVVIAIIGLLVAILVPSLSGARTQSKIVATQSLNSSLSVSLDQFKQESRLSGNYPQSASDDDGTAQTPRKIADPFKDNPVSELQHTTGASLLVYGLNGADGLGTPGFTDLKGDDGLWYNDFGTTPNTPGTPPYGAHALDPNSREPLVPRYGPYAATDPQTKSIQSLGKLIEKGTLLAPLSVWDSALDKGDYKHLVFTDAWSHPILYYRARRAARAIVPLTSPAAPGVFDPTDNASIVGDGTAVVGLQFKVGPAGVHKLANVKRDLTPDKDPVMLSDPNNPQFANYVDTFEKFIFDSKVSGRITPVNKDTYLLISAGPDAVYGTPDDVTNFGKN